MGLSKAQVDSLGEALRSGTVTEDHLGLLASWRDEFQPALQSVLDAETFRLATFAPTASTAPGEAVRSEVTARVETTQSIEDKLKRQPRTRLSQLQDIVGCRRVVEDLEAQDRVAAALCREFRDHRLEDRRAKPSHGYRAVHIVVRLDGYNVEVQVRTVLQHLWAQLSEHFAAYYGQEIKYGSGEPEVLDGLGKLSASIAAAERHGRSFGDYHPSAWFLEGLASRRVGWRRTQRPQPFDLTLNGLVSRLRKEGAIS